KAPVVFACRSRARAHGGARVAERAVAYGLASARVDGSDALAVVTVIRAALARAREGRGATLVELIVPILDRLASPETVRDDAGVLDLGPGDPIARLGALLAREKRIDAAAHDQAIQGIRAELELAVTEAEAAGRPATPTIFDDVYAAVPPHLAAQ